MYRIITDTSANLELELLERKGIAEIPFSFSMPEKGGDALYCPDFSAFDSKAFYDAMRSGTRVTTSQITPAQYTEKMRPLLEAGQDILFIGMSSGVSGSFQAGMVAAAQLRAEFPERSIELIDTLGASLGEGLVVLRAAELRDSGIALSAAVHLLSDYRDRMCQVFECKGCNRQHFEYQTPFEGRQRGKNRQFRQSSRKEKLPARNCGTIP